MSNKSKIAIIGAAGVGKTTLLDALFDPSLSLRGERSSTWQSRYVKIEEVVRKLCAERGYDSPYPISEDMNQFRFDVLTKQIELEKQAGSFIVDRSTIDAWAYYMRWSWNSSTVETSEEFYQLAYEQAQNYDLLIYLPIMFEVKDDGYRWANPVYQKQVDRLLRSIINDWDLKDMVYEIKSETTCHRLQELSCFFSWV
ncbi:MAG: ATP-binding protein [Candidatus Melainabacteria bacterium]|nr:ATP-binding protein [Candidatus Melainabacteria bacterium]